MTDHWPEVRNAVAGRGAPFPASENAVAVAVHRAPISAYRFRCHALLPSRESCRLRAVQRAHSDGSRGLSRERERDNIMLGVRSNPHGECAAPAHPPTLLPSSGKPVSISVGRKRGSGSCSISQHGRHGTAARYLPWNHAPFGDWRLPFPALSAAHLPDMSVLACVPNGSSCPSPLTRCFRNRCRADTARR